MRSRLAFRRMLSTTRRRHHRPTAVRLPRAETQGITEGTSVSLRLRGEIRHDDGSEFRIQIHGIIGQTRAVAVERRDAFLRDGVV